MKKILIVDYDQSSLSSLHAVLADRGYTVVTAADGQAGWDKYNKESPDLVLMEAMLPKVHGFELCQRITSERNSQATVFIMTGVYKDRVYRTEALRTYGASEYFEKPLKMAELLASVEAILGKPEAKPAEAPTEAPTAAPSHSATTGLSAESRRREKSKSDDSLFALPEDLDRLAREIPKTRKAAVTSTSESASEPRLDALADDLLKAVLVEAQTPKPAAPKTAPENGNGNGNGKADIDQFLASALAGLDLNKEKVKVPKTAPLPSPATMPVKEAPEPKPTAAPAPPTTATPATSRSTESSATTRSSGTTELPAGAKPRPAPAPSATIKSAAPAEKATPSGPAPAPEPAASATSATIRPAGPAELPKTAADMKSTLTPGDPGSDLSPFFTPEKPKPSATTRAAAPPELAAPPEKPKSQPVAAPPIPAPAQKTGKPVEKTVKPAAPAATGLSTKTGAATMEPARTAPPVSATSATSATTRPTGPTESAKAEPSATTRSTGSQRPEPLRAEPLSADLSHKEIQPTVGGDIFQDFHPAEKSQRSGGFPKLVPIVIGVVAIAAVGFILLRPKAKAPAPSVTRETVENQSPTNTPSQPVVEPPADPAATSTTTGSPGAPKTNSGAGASVSAKSAGPTELPVAKPAPAKQKVQPKAKPAEADPAGADAILPILNNSSAALPPPPGSQPASGGSQPGGQGETQQAKTEESAVQSGSETGAGNPIGSGQVADGGSPVAENPAAAPVKEGDLVELGSVTEPPRLIKSADPIYPQTAQRLGIGGSITVNALIDENGNVVETGILKGIKDDKGLGRAAETAVRKWKFQPARKNGVAVKVWKSFVIAFKADANPANRME